MHAKRCAILVNVDPNGNPRVRRRVDASLRRYLVLEGATVFLGHGARDIVANVIVTGIDIDALLPEIEAVETFYATLEISEDGCYRATLASRLPLPAYHSHKTTA